MEGVVLGLLAALGFGGSAVFARLGLQHMRSTTGTLASLLVGTVIMLTLAFALHSDEILAIGGVVFLWLLLSAIINFPMGRLLNYTGVRLAGVSRASPVVGASPLFAIVLAITVGGESIDLPTLLGAFSIIGGLFLVLSQR